MRRTALPVSIFSGLAEYHLNMFLRPPKYRAENVLASDSAKYPRPAKLGKPRREDVFAKQKKGAGLITAPLK